MAEADENFESDFPAEIVKEGNVRLVVPKLKAFVRSPSDYAPSKAPVFYNPVMELNRDFTVLALGAYQKMVNRGLVVCEPLAGSGAMGVRLAAEVKGVKRVVIADISRKASKLANQNVQINGLAERVTVENVEANLLMSGHGTPRKRFDVIDIDPFGSPVPFLDSAVRALRDEGLIAVTATDMAPLCGVHPKACIRKYGGKPLRTEYCHELAIRLLAGCLSLVAAKHATGVSMLFSHSSDHYIRVYAMVRYGAKQADESIGKMGYAMHCFKCLHREAVRKTFQVERSARCSECGSELSLAGPLWLGKIADRGFCELMENGAKKRTLRLGGKILKTLSLIKEESDTPFSYYVIDELSSLLRLPVPPVRRVLQKLKDEGFEACLTHFDSRGIKSNAPAMKMQEILRETASEIDKS